MMVVRRAMRSRLALASMLGAWMLSGFLAGTVFLRPSSSRAAATPPPSAAMAAEVAVSGMVFKDDDADGELDPGELGLPGVKVSNGVDVIETAADGSFTLTVVRDDSRFVLLTVPRGYRATRGFYHRVSEEATDSAVFGLTPDPAADTDHFRFVHASDSHVFDAMTAGELGSALQEIADLEQPADFVIITGDLTNSGSTTQLSLVADQLATPPLPVYAGFGDHDANADSLLVRNFENLIGPTYYSFDRGPYHFVIHNDISSASLDGNFRQLTWLANDIAAAAGQTIYVFAHFQPNRQEIDLYRSLGVTAVFSGHWHANRMRVVDGVLSVNTGPLRMAGIDRSSRSFRVIDLDAGELRMSLRTGGIAPRIAIVDPPAGVSPYGTVPIRAMGYSTSTASLAARFTVNGPTGQVASGDLTPTGGWGLAGSFQLNAPDPASYDITVELLQGATVMASATQSVTLDHVVAPTGVPGAAWSRFRGNAAGFVSADAGALAPPLRLKWARHIGGPSELASPVIADGHVFMAHSVIDQVGTPALVALDLTTGAEVWRHPTGAEVKGTPAVADGRVVIITTTGEVEAVDASTGAPLWSRPLGDPADRFDVTSPIIDGGVVYVGGAKITAALDAATGAVIWQKELGEDWLATIHSAPVCDATRVACGLFTGIFVLDRSSGDVLWSHSTRGQETYRSPALVGDVLYSAGDTFGSHRLRAFDAATGDILWTAPFSSGNSNSAPAVGDSVVIIGTGNQTLEAFARADGQLLWTFAVGAPIASGRPYSNDVATVTSSPLIAGSVTYFGADDGRLYAVDLASGTSPWSADLGAPVRSSPAASGNYLLAATVDGTLFAFVAGDMVAAGIGEAPSPPALRLGVGPAWPNPYRSGGTIPFVIPAGVGDGKPTAARLRVIDAMGRHVRTLVDGPVSPGRHEVRWDGRDGAGRLVASGVYFVRLEAGRARAATRVSIVR